MLWLGFVWDKSGFSLAGDQPFSERLAHGIKAESNREGHSTASAPLHICTQTHTAHRNPNQARVAGTV